MKKLTRTDVRRSVATQTNHNELLGTHLVAWIPHCIEFKIFRNQLQQHEHLTEACPWSLIVGSFMLYKTELTWIWWNTSHHVFLSVKCLDNVADEVTVKMHRALFKQGVFRDYSTLRLHAESDGICTDAAFHPRLLNTLCTLTWFDTNTVNGPASANIPICDAHTRLHYILKFMPLDNQKLAIQWHNKSVQMQPALRAEIRAGTTTYVAHCDLLLG